MSGDGDVAFSGVIGDTANAGTYLSLTKTGAGTLTVADSNSYTGPTTIHGGVLVVSSLADAGSPSSIGAAADYSTNLVLNGGTLRYESVGAVSTDRKFAVGLTGGMIDSSAVDPADTVTFATTLPMGFNSELGARTLTLTGSNTGDNTISLLIGDADAASPTSIVKAGSGTWILTNDNTHTGGTTVSEGKLVLTSSDCLDDGSTVTIAAGAELNLPNSGTDVVASLVINDVTMEAGVYNSSNTGGAITGAGAIEVVGGAGGTAFENWMAGSHPEITSPDNAADADPDNDGVPNILEFALNGNPSDSSDNGALAPLIQASSLKLVVAVRDGANFASGATATVDGITYTVEGSLNLAFPGSAVSSTGPSDTAPAATGLPDLTGTAWEYHTFTLDASAGLPGKGFLRLKVTQP